MSPGLARLRYLCQQGAASKSLSRSVVYVQGLMLVWANVSQDGATCPIRCGISANVVEVTSIFLNSNSFFQSPNVACLFLIPLREPLIPIANDLGQGIVDVETPPLLVGVLK
jgi:hypothetical protein